MRGRLLKHVVLIGHDILCDVGHDFPCPSSLCSSVADIFEAGLAGLSSLPVLLGDLGEGHLVRSLQSTKAVASQLGPWALLETRW